MAKTQFGVYKHPIVQDLVVQKVFTFKIIHTIAVGTF